MPSFKICIGAVKAVTEIYFLIKKYILMTLLQHYKIANKVH